MPATRRLRRLLRDEPASTSSTPTTGCPAGARGSPAPGRSSSASTAPTSAIRSSGAMSRRLARRIDLAAAVSARALRRGGRPARPAAAPRLGGPPLRAGPRPLRPDAARRGAARARPRPRTAATCSSPPTRRGPRSAPTAPRELAEACGRRAAHRRLDRARADAALDQRRQRRPRHLRLRGLRDDLHRGARLRRAGPLDPGRDRPLRPRRDRGRALRRRSSSTAWSGRRAAAPGRPPTRGSTAPGGRPRSPRRGWRSARSRPTATFSAAS